MKVLIVKNISREGPGLLRDVLEENSIHYDIIDLDSNEEIPEPEAYSAIFVFGGPDSANDNTDRMEKELETIRKSIKNEIPYLGICLGMQALVKACGGEVRRNDVKEVGWKNEDGEYFTIDLIAENSAATVTDPIFTGLESPLRIFHLHGETVDITDNMELLATGKFCRNQVVKVSSNAYGFQGHFELNPEMFREWIDIDPDLKVLDRDKLMDDFDEVYGEYSGTGKTIFTNFLRIAGLI